MLHYRSGSLVAGSLAVAALSILLHSSAAATPTEPKCSQPVSSGANPVASDCLFILKVAVGLETCSPACICAPIGTLPTKASDALFCLGKATNQPLTLNCPCEGGGGGPVDPDDFIGLVTASRNRLIIPNLFRGIPLTITEDMSLGAVFGVVTGTISDPDITTTTEDIAGCTVITTQQTIDLGGGGIPNFMALDAGSPGSADNGSAQIDMVLDNFGFEPAEDPLAAGFDGGQTIEFAWPGGSDINGFSATIAVPPTIMVTAPDLTDPAFDLVPGQAINAGWSPGPDEDGDMTVTASSTTSQTVFVPPANVTTEINSVTIICMFPDASGSGTVPSAATSRLYSSAPLGATLAKVLSFERENEKQVPVSAPGVSGPDVIGFFGLSSITRSITSGFSFP